MISGIDPIGPIYAPPLQGDGNIKERLLKTYLTTQDPFTIPFVVNLSEATMPVYNMDSSIAGNCVAIATNFVLTCAHCIHEQFGLIGSDALGEVIVDGTTISPHEKLDFKILWVEGANFKPVTLDVMPNDGNSIQIYFKMDEKEVLQPYVRPLESVGGNSAMRSNFTNAKTGKGESGAPRMSLSTGFVHSIHQGAGEGLQVNDIYTLLKKTSKTPSHPQQAVVAQLLNQIRVENLEMLLMAWSPIAIQQGAVPEEKSRVHGKVYVSGQVNGKKIGANFGYREEGEGKGPRKIIINHEGVAGSSVTYSIAPHPDKNNNYHGNEPQFYKELAISVGMYYLEHGQMYLAAGTLNALGENYNLNIIYS